MSVEYFSVPEDPEVFQQLHDLGVQDPAFGTSGKFDVTTHSERVRNGWLALSQAAHDRVIGHGTETPGLSSDGTVGRVNGTAYTYDDVTNTSFSISTSDMVGGSVQIRLQSVTPHDAHAQAAGFYKKHDMRLVYDSSGRVDDSMISEAGTDVSGSVVSTAMLDTKDPDAFTRMAESLERSHESTRKKYERESLRVAKELATGHIGRFASLKTLFRGDAKDANKAWYEDMVRNAQGHI